MSQFDAILRTRDWQERRRARGECIQCGEPHEAINPRTGQRYARCVPCRVKMSLYQKAWHLRRTLSGGSG